MKSPSRSGRIYPEGKPLLRFADCGPQSCGTPARNRSPTIKPVAGDYTERRIAALIIIITIIIAVVPIFNKGNRALVSNYRPLSIFNNFSKICESILHDHFSFYFKFKLHPNQHSFVKSKSTATNSLTYLNDVLPHVCA
jgi:hypothetical protein